MYLVSRLLCTIEIKLWPLLGIIPFIGSYPYQYIVYVQCTCACMQYYYVVHIYNVYTGNSCKNLIGAHEVHDRSTSSNKALVANQWSIDKNVSCDLHGHLCVYSVCIHLSLYIYIII